MKYLILFLALLTTNVFANTVSRQSGLTIDGRTYARDDIVTLWCGIETGGEHTTCLRSDGTSAAVGSGFKILAIRALNYDPSSVGRFCLKVHSSAAVVDDITEPSGGSNQWIYGRDCSGSGILEYNTLISTLNFIGTGDARNRGGIGELSGIDYTIPTGERVSVKYTGHNSGGLLFIYGVDL